MRMVASVRVRVLEKAREVVRLQWACVAAACGFLGLQVVFGGWWWSVSVVFAVAVAVLVLVHFLYVREFEGASTAFDAPASGRSARWER
ncbi:hypothetical protein ACWDUD_28465 [Rhodococcus sp. NPDC003382]